MRSPGRGYYGGPGPGSRGSAGPPPPPPSSGRPYKVLCVSSLHSKASDDVVRDTLYREYKKYGDISVRVVIEPDERVAYVYFRNFEDARDARHSKSRIILFDKPALVEPVYESRSESSGPPPSSSYGGRGRRSMSPLPPSGGGGYGGGGSRYRSRSPVDNYGGGGRRGDYRDDYHHHQPHHHREQHHYQPRGRGGYHRGGYRHRGGHHGGHYNDHHGGGGGGGGHRGRHYDRRDGPPQHNRGQRDKFPNYLNHIPPEEDPLATRTLFAGNLELNITDEEMKRIFGRYGRLVDIDVKRPAPGTGNAYAFVRYENLDQAHRAKVELSGQYIGKFQCKIGYGKVNATTKVWVGGLGAWCSENILWKEFDRFGAIQKIEYQKGDSQAHIFYESMDAAQAAVQEMRGFPLGGPDKRLRIDYADLDVPTGLTSRRPAAEERDINNGDRDRNYPPNRGGGYREGGAGRDDWSGNGNRRVEEPMDGGRGRRHSGSSMDREGSPGGADENISMAQTVAEICRKMPKVWDGGLILKNSLFPTKLHLIEGNRRIADALKDEQERTNLKITQRLRLDQNKLDDVTKRMSNSSSHAVFLGMSTSTSIQHENPEIQSRPLRNLISYLRQREAAGVISMTYKESEDNQQQGVLYCFPPCTYSLDLLRREAPNVTDESSKDDHLLVVVVCGSHS